MLKIDQSANVASYSESKLDEMLLQLADYMGRKIMLVAESGELHLFELAAVKKTDAKVERGIYNYDCYCWKFKGSCESCEPDLRVPDWKISAIDTTGRSLTLNGDLNVLLQSGEEWKLLIQGSGSEKLDEITSKILVSN